MLLSELCVVTVSVPASVTRTQRGKGGLLKFRFSPYTQIEFLRVAILKVCVCCSMHEGGREEGERETQGGREEGERLREGGREGGREGEREGGRLREREAQREREIL